MPSTVNEASVPLGVLRKLSGLFGGVHDCPCAGAAKHCTARKAPGLTDTDAIVVPGRAASAMKFATAGAAKLRSDVNACVPDRPAKTPLVATVVKSMPVNEIDAAPD